MLEDPLRRFGSSTQAFYPAPIGIQQRHYPPGRAHGLFGSVLAPVRKNASQASQSPVSAHARQQVVVSLPMRLKEQAQVEDRLSQRSRRAQQERDEQPPQPAVPIQACSGGGGTNAAFPGRVPPIQFWLV